MVSSRGCELLPEQRSARRRRDRQGAVRQHRLELAVRHRARQQVALSEPAADAAQRGELAGMFDALGHHPQVQRLRHAEDRLDERTRLAFAVDALDEGSIDFQYVDRQPAQVSDGGVAGPEIVDGQRYSEFSQAVQDFQWLTVVVDQHAFGDLEDELGRVHVPPQAAYLIEHRAVAQLLTGQVDAERQWSAERAGQFA